MSVSGVFISQRNAVVQGHVGLDLPAVLREQIERSAAHEFMLRGALEEAVAQYREGSWDRHRRNPGRLPIGEEAEERNAKVAVDVKIEQLVEHLIADIAAKLQAVIADDFAVVVAELKGIAGLRQLAVEVVADGKAAADVDEGNSFFARAEA